MNVLKPHVSLNVSNIDVAATKRRHAKLDRVDALEIFVVKGNAPVMRASGGCCGPKADATS